MNMQTPVSIIISGPYNRSCEIARACLAAGIYPTLLLSAQPAIENNGTYEFHITFDPFTCVADLVIDCSNDPFDTIVSRFNQLSEINHADVVFCLNGDLSDFDKWSSQIMNPGRVVGIKGMTNQPSIPQVIRTPHTTNAAFEYASGFLRMLAEAIPHS
jgi:hypothetical protein